MDTCSICLEDDVLELIQLDCLCDVKYCLECISKWFINNEEDICPICKEVVDVRYNDVKNDDYQLKIVYNNYFYKVLNNDYILTLTKYKTFNISCLNGIIYVQVNGLYNDIINDMVSNFITKISDDVVKRPSLVDCIRDFDNNLRCIYQENDTSIFYQNKNIIIKLAYIEFNTVSQKYYPYFEIIGFA